MRQKLLIILLLIVSRVICGSLKKRDIPICKTCTITAVNGDKKLGLENDKTCMIDEVLCKDYLDVNYCIGYTVEFKYMGTSYGKEYNKTCIVNPIAEQYSICDNCYIKLEDKEFSWGYDDNEKLCLIDIFKCNYKDGDGERTYPYYIFILDFSIVFLICWLIIKKL